jgi:hypothetical protein
MSMPASITCSCSHSVDCNHECHGRHCDPTEHVCSIEFLPDEGGLARWGCAECTPGMGLPHFEGCAAGAAPIAFDADQGRAGQPSAPLS